MKKSEFTRRERDLSEAETRVHNIKTKRAANVAVHSSNIDEPRAQQKRLHIDSGRKEVLENELKALTAMAARLEAMDR